MLDTASSPTGWKLNLGCGRVILPDFLNADRYGAEVVCDAMALPFRDGSFNEVVMVHALEHISDLDRAVREVHRVLGRGGLFTVIVPYGLRFLYNLHHHHAFSLVSMNPFLKTGNSLQTAPLFRLRVRKISDYTFPWKWHLHTYFPWLPLTERGFDNRIRSHVPLGPRREITFILEAEKTPGGRERDRGRGVTRPSSAPSTRRPSPWLSRLL